VFSIALVFMPTSSGCAVWRGGETPGTAPPPTLATAPPPAPSRPLHHPCNRRAHAPSRPEDRSTAWACKRHGRDTATDSAQRARCRMCRMWQGAGGPPGCPPRVPPSSFCLFCSRSGVFAHRTESTLGSAAARPQVKVGAPLSAGFGRESGKEGTALGFPARTPCLRRRRWRLG